MNKKRLTKNAYDKKIFGVCSGIADYFEVDPTLIRLGWVLCIFAFGTGIFAYLISAFIMPEDPRIIK